MKAKAPQPLMEPRNDDGSSLVWSNLLTVSVAIFRLLWLNFHTPPSGPLRNILESWCTELHQSLELNYIMMHWTQLPLTSTSCGNIKNQSINQNSPWLLSLHHRLAGRIHFMRKIPHWVQLRWPATNSCLRQIVLSSEGGGAMLWCPRWLLRCC